MRRPVDYNQVTGRYFHNPMTYLRIAQHWQVRIHRISGPEIDQVLLQRNSLIMISLPTATDLTAKIEDIWNSHGKLDSIAPATDCISSVTIYSKVTLHPSTFFNINLGDMYAGWGDLIAIGR